MGLSVIYDYRQYCLFQVVQQGEMTAVFRRIDGHLLSHAPYKNQERRKTNLKRQQRRNN